jgi:hypothetical protein
MVKDQESSCDEEMPVDETANGEDGAKIGNSEYEPYKFSGKNYSLDMVAHKPLLRGLRKWALNYMGTNQCIQLNQYTQLEKLNEQERGRDIDLLVKVLKVSEKDEQTLELRIKDNTNILWFLMLPKLKFGGIINIRPGEIVRVRSVVKEVTTRRNVITAKATTNILKFVENAKVIKTMTERIEELKDTEKILLEDDSEVIMQQVAMTEIISTNPEMEQEKIFKLQDLFLNWDQIDDAMKERNFFKVVFCTFRIDPEDERDIVVAMCPKCNDTINCKDLGSDGAAKCKECNVDCKLIYQM